MVMMRTKRNPPIWLEGEGVIPGYDHIASCINSKQNIVKVNIKLADKLSA